MSEAISMSNSVKPSKSTVKDSRVLTYLGGIGNSKLSVNSAADNELVQLWRQKYLLAKAEYENSRCNSKNVKKWRDAYEAGIFTEFMEQRGPGHTVGSKKAYEKGAGRSYRPLRGEMPYSRTANPRA